MLTGQKLMQKLAKCAIALLIVVVGMSACSRQAQKTLAHRLKDADHVIVMNPDNGVTMTIVDEQLKKIVQALEASQEVRAKALSASPGYTLVFYKGAVHLATVPTGAELIFWIDKTPYQDKSGTLRAVCERFWEKHPSNR